MPHTLLKVIPTELILWYESFILKNYNRTKSFLTNTDPKLLEEISKKKALYVFKLASKNVPAYKKFLKEHNINPDEINTIEDFKKIPITTKENYIKKYSYEERCIEGKFPIHGSIDESSGSSGTPTNWIRSKEEVDRILKAAQFEYDYDYDPLHKKYIIISAWSMGAWATGVKFAEITENFSIVKSTGPDVDKIITTIKTFGRKYNYLIGGYPPFLKKLVDEGAKKINWKNYKVDFVTGGEGFVEEWREYIRKKIGNPNAIIISSYGASDIDIGIAFETPFSIFIRNLALKNKKFAKELFGGAGINATIFQYDVTEHYIENMKEKGKPTFHITLINPVVASPKIKYSLKDEGNVIHFDEMLDILKKFAPNYIKEFRRQGLRGEDILKLPFLFVTKRMDDTISIDGANIYPAQISLCLHKDKQLQEITHSFKIGKKCYKNQNISFCTAFELRKGIKPTKELKKKYHKAIIEHLTEINDDFEESYLKNKKAADPHVALYTYHSGPFAEEGLIKNKYLLQPAEIATILLFSFILSLIRNINFGANKITGLSIAETGQSLFVYSYLIPVLSFTIMVFSVLLSLYGLIKLWRHKKRE